MDPEATNLRLEGLYERIKELLGPAPMVVKLPELFNLTLRSQVEIGSPTVAAKTFDRELVKMTVEFPNGKQDDYVIVQQGSTNYSVIYAEKDGEKFFLCVEQYRPTVTKKLGEAKIVADFPGGYNSEDSEIDALLEALRELGEEAGVSIDDISDVKIDLNYIDGIYMVRNTDPENTILFGKYLKEFDPEPKLCGSVVEGERTVAVWYSEAEVKDLLRRGRFGTPGVVAYALTILD